MLKNIGLMLGAFGTAVASNHKAVSIGMTGYEEDELGLKPPFYFFDFMNPIRYYDAASIRRGHQVYQQICATCHKNEIKALAAEFEFEDGPNDEGEMFERPGKFTDSLPSPYANDNMARFANNGAIPPDLSNIIKARVGEAHYIFALLTGYREPPAGVEVREGLSYNPYFPGGLIAMPQQVTDECIDYDDGTPNTASQIAKDVTYFLEWASYPEHDMRINFFWKAETLFIITLLTTLWVKRYRFAPLKSKRIIVDTLN